MVVGAVVFAALGIVTLLNQPAPFIFTPLGFVRALPALLFLLFGILLGFGGYRLLKGRK